ncbi:PREDICTED: uncharacterized protein LOC106113341 [Papilio xuthus]|uniref:Uncharacterized protein LOC106113341 n=1 Tax=Papilio xuthus TaxID=66420 RepID=A0AAJ6YYJ7_PAPXU|nr:PREDICTED: uncharacterized protein LOC106113341 [Papilio xuthus]
MKTLWRFTVSLLFMCFLISTVNTSETEEDDSDEFSSLETQSDEEINSKINNEETSHEITKDYEKSLYDEYERRRKLQTIHDNLATKLQKALVEKLKSPEFSQRINLTAVENYLQHDLDVPSGRRSFNKDKLEVALDDNPNEDGRRNYVKKVTYVIDQKPSHAHIININDGNIQSLNQAVSSSRTTIVTNNNNVKIPYHYLNNDPQMTKTSLPNYYVYGQPYLDFTNPIQMYYNYYPGNRLVKFNNNFFDYSNHVRAQNRLNDYKKVTAYLTSLMDADNYVNPNVVQILKGADELNLSEINNFDRRQLVQIKKSDLDYLKKYITIILNQYGMTPYIFKLLEYVNLLDGRSRNEIYLVFKILSNQQAVYGLNRIESDQLKSHLQYIINEYDSKTKWRSFLP